jgi:hypothetical protein
LYRHILNQLHEIVGGKAPYVFIAGIALLVLALALMLLPAWRRAVKSAAERGGWRGIVMGTISVFLALIVGATVIEALRGSLLLKAREFENTHGRVSQTNYNAVKTNMGPPHEQGELRVSHYLTEEKTVYQYKDGRQIPEEEIQTADGDGGGDLLAPAGDEKDRPERPIKRKIKVRKEVPQNSVVRGLVEIDLHMNYRQKGSAYYTCYDDAWKMDFLVRNRSDKETEAEFAFPMPADQGLYDKFTILVDGKNWAEHLVSGGNAQTWKMPMKPNQEVSVHVEYTSRGMDYLRYRPLPMATRETYKVTMRIFPQVRHDDRPALGEQQLVWTKHMSLPIGSMTPQTITDSPAEGEPMVLAWDLQSAATSLDMGVILPKIAPPGYYSVRLLHEAPTGLLLLAAALVISWMLLGRPADLFSLAFLAVAYYLFFTLFAYLSDGITSFAMCFAVATLATLVLAALYLWAGWGVNYASTQTLGLVAVMTIYYPLAVTSDDSSGVLLQGLYWFLALYAAKLAVDRMGRERRALAALQP